MGISSSLVSLLLKHQKFSTFRNAIYSSALRMLRPQLICPLYVLKWSMPPLSGIHAYQTVHTNSLEKIQQQSARWVTNDYSTYSIVSAMLVTELAHTKCVYHKTARLIILSMIIVLSKCHHIFKRQQDQLATTILSILLPHSLTPLHTRITIYLELS